MAVPLAVAGTVAAGAYLNAKLHIYKDVRTLVLMKIAENEWTTALKQNRGNVFYVFEENARKYSDIECIWSRSGTYTWRQTYERVCQYGNYFLSLGVQPGSIVAIYLTNAPEFMFTWLGLLSIGCAPAMINNNLAADALVHCVKIAGAEILFFDDDAGCQERISASRDRLVSEAGAKLVMLSEELRASIAASDSSRPRDEYRVKGQGKAPCSLIYTSGTTGFAKAVPFTMPRAYMGAAAARFGIRGRPSSREGDKWYVCMPLYHGTGGISTMSNMAIGNQLAIGKRFSTRGFWKDIRDSQSTAFVYVGETARYLLAAPPSPDDRNHKARVMFGNGMRPDVWGRFQERFGIEEVGEFFNSTEGMLAVIIHSRSGYGRGAVGHHGAIMRGLMHNVHVPVKLDLDTGDIWRDPETGFAKRQPYEVGGEIIVRLNNITDFPGYYRSEKDTNKKMVRDVFKKGDIYYRTGDALRRTDDGLWHFLDRLGDTFRWKGENVSTAEVAQVLGDYPGIDEANVYGILVPYHDGRAGCAAITLSSLASSGSFNWQELANFVRQRLPSYAVPLFIRVMDGEAGELASHNNKQDKVRLRDEGVDPGKKGSRVPNGEAHRIYWLPQKDSGYVPFEKDHWEELQARQVKL